VLSRRPARVGDHMNDPGETGYRVIEPGRSPGSVSWPDEAARGVSADRIRETE